MVALIITGKADRFPNETPFPVHDHNHKDNREKLETVIDQWSAL